VLASASGVALSTIHGIVRIEYLAAVGETSERSYCHHRRFLLTLGRFGRLLVDQSGLPGASIVELSYYLVDSDVI
jgi:hypothetical protein